MNRVFVFFLILSIEIYSSLGQVSSTDQTNFLNLHNAARTKVNQVALVWNSTIAVIAQNYANTCPTTHNPNRGNLGENLYCSATSSGFPTGLGTSASDDWISECSNFNCTANTCSTSCLHYTQIIWSTTISFGCGITNCVTNSPFSGFPNWTTVVCDYYTQGNIVGQRPVPVSDCPVAGVSQSITQSGTPTDTVTTSVSSSVSTSVSSSVSTSGTPTESSSVSTSGTQTGITSSQTSSFSETLTVSTVTNSGSQSTSVSNTQTISNSITGTMSMTDTITGTMSMTDTMTGTMSMTDTTTGTMSMTATISMTATMSMTATLSMTATMSMTATVSMTETMSLSVSISGTLSPHQAVCGNGIVEKGEVCDPGPTVKKWWKQCCNFKCGWRKANKICENRSRSQCVMPRRCDGNGNCIDPHKNHPKGYVCEKHDGSGKTGKCNGKGTCIFKS